MKRVPLITVPEGVKLGYFAGLLDGEGHVRISKAFSRSTSRRFAYSIEVAITNTNPLLMTWLLDTVGGSIFNKSRASHPAHWKRAMCWHVFGDNAAALLTAVEPLLVLKREQARIALELRRLQRAQNVREITAADVAVKESLKQRLHVLNARGA